MLGLSVKTIFFFLISFSVILEMVADVLFKKWAIAANSVLLIIGLIFYAAGTVFWAVSLKYELLSKAISIFTVLNLIAIVLIGLLYFKENLSLINKVGIGLGILSIILIEL